MSIGKKSAEITGRLRYPLVIGMPAYIKEGDGFLRTSCVVSVGDRTSSHVHFETKNTNYCLHFEGGIQYERAYS